MADTRGIRAGRAFVELFADDSKLVRGLRRAEKRLKAFGNSIRTLGLKIAALGTAMLAPMVGVARAFSSIGDQVAKMAKRTGLSVEALSELKFVASQTGTEFESLEMGLRRMQRSIYDAGRGLSTAKDTLSDLCLRFEDLDGLSPEEQFKLLGEAIRRIEDPTKKAAIAMTLFGRTGTNLLPMFALGARGIEELQRQARRLGLTMSSEDARAAEDFTDALDRLWKVIKMGVFRVGAALAPLLQKLTDRFTEISVKVNSWIDQNRRLVVSFVKIAAGIVAGGMAMVVLGTIISGLGTVLGGLITIATTVAGGFKLLIGVMGFLLSPIGLVVAAVGALGTALVTTGGMGSKVLAWLGERFKTLKDEAMKSYQGIADALAAGDITLAAKILWLSLKMQWQKGVNGLLDAWLTFKESFLRIAFGAFYGAQALWQNVVHSITVAWIEGVAALQKVWANFSAWHARAVESTAQWIAKKWLWLQSLFDDSIDMEFVTHSLEQESKQQFEKIESQRQQAIDQAQRQRDGKRETADQQHVQHLAEIGQDYEDQSHQLQSQHDQRMLQAQAELAQARSQWQEAIDTARQNRQSMGGDTGASGNLDELTNKLQSVLEGLGDQLAQKAISVTGTFSGMEAGGLGAGSAVLRTANAAEETARNTRRLVDAAKHGGLIFT